MKENKKILISEREIKIFGDARNVEGENKILKRLISQLLKIDLTRDYPIGGLKDERDKI